MLKNTKKVTAFILIIVSLASCTTSYTAGNSGKVPPGKAKKITGSKSAKPYAPGQRKKK